MSIHAIMQILINDLSHLKCYQRRFKKFRNFDVLKLFVLKQFSHKFRDNC